jgi:hypothetical protein
MGAMDGHGEAALQVSGRATHAAGEESDMLADRRRASDPGQSRVAPSVHDLIRSRARLAETASFGGASFLLSALPPGVH